MGGADGGKRIQKFMPTPLEYQTKMQAASGEKQITAGFMRSGSFSLLPDLFDSYPPSQERVR